MCVNCTYRLRACDHLNFKGMPVHHKAENYIVVICSEYQKDKKF